MTFAADESVSGPIVDRLLADGWAVSLVRDTHLGVEDPVVLALAAAAPAVLLTEDKDFGELVYHRNLSHAGVVLIRLDGLRHAIRAGIVSGAVRAHQAALPGAFTVISPSGVRIRRPGPPPPADPS